MSSEKFTEKKNKISTEYEVIMSISKREMDIKFIELFEQSENSIETKIVNVMESYYKDHVPLYPLMQTLLSNTHQLWNKSSQTVIASDRLFEELMQLCQNLIKELKESEDKIEIAEAKLEAKKEVTTPIISQVGNKPYSLNENQKILYSDIKNMVYKKCKGYKDNIGSESAVSRILRELMALGAIHKTGSGFDTKYTAN